MLTEFIVSKSGSQNDGNFDPGELTLVEAVGLANANPGEDSIIFRFGATSILVPDPLVITDDLTIGDPGQNTFTRLDSFAGVIFDIQSGATVALADLSINGEVHNAGNLAMERVWVERGIDNSGDLAIINSFVTGLDFNEGMNPDRDGRGGGIYTSGGSVHIANSTISDSAARFFGGGIYVENSSVTIVNSTITGNIAGGTSSQNTGSGIFVGVGGDVSLFNTIIAGNSANNSDLIGVVDPNSSFNLIGNASAAGGLIHGVNGNIVGNNGTGILDINTILDTDLAANGSWRANHALVPGSPALDSGNIALAKDVNGNQLVTDQRVSNTSIVPGVPLGSPYPRVSGAGIDRGAYELQVPEFTLNDDVAAFNTTTGVWQIGISDTDAFSDTRGPRWSTAVTWETFTGDVNNDGLTDLIGRQRENGNWWVAVNQGNGTFQTRSFLKWAPDAAANWENVQVADVNGDGRDDIIGMTNGNWWGAISTGTRFVNQYLGKWEAAGWQTIFSGDLNGDGNDDVFGFRPATGEWYAGLYNGSRYSFRMFETWDSTVAWSNFQTGDFTGDGNTDILAQAGSGYWYYVSLNTQLNGETTYAGRTTTAYAPNNAPIVDDFNGDGLSDLAVINTRREVFVKLGTGMGLADPAFWGTAPANRSLVSTGDFNSDGRADLLYFTPNTGGWIALLGSEEQFTPNAFGTWTGLPLSGFEKFEVGNFG